IRSAKASTIVEPERVCCTDCRRGRFAYFGCRERVFLVRDGDVATGQTLVPKCAQEGLDVARRNGAPGVAAVDSVAVEPIAVDCGRARMLDRPADDAGVFHAQSILRCLNSFKSGRRGSPNMVE